jgi:hypothetical protein
MSKQFQRAYRLALAHSHEWACAVTGPSQWDEAGRRYANAPAPRSWSEAEAAYAAWVERESVDPHFGHFPRAGSGLPIPERIEGAVHHVTASGRLTWVVYEDGTTVLAVGRPCYCQGEPVRDKNGVVVGVIVLRATVDPEGAVALEQCGDFEGRHAATLADALRDLDVDLEPLPEWLREATF